jgi:DNA polymerase
VAKTQDWLKGRGFTLENLQDDTLQEALGERVLPEDVRRALDIRLAVAPTSLSKFERMLACAGPDDRARGLFQYHAATTGRFSAQLIQPQNLPRPSVDIADGEIEELVEVVKRRDPAALARWGDPLEVLSSALRFALTAADGARFGIGDFSMIETCVLLALAGQRDKCRMIEQGVDVYRDMAALVYGLDRAAFLAIPKDELTIEQAEQRRMGGKNPVLACGYGLGPDAFRLRYCRHMPRDEAVSFAENAVRNYRLNWAPGVPRLWRNLESTAQTALRSPGTLAVAACGISYRRSNRLVCSIMAINLGSSGSALVIAGCSTTIGCRPRSRRQPVRRAFLPRRAALS